MNTEHEGGEKNLEKKSMKTGKIHITCILLFFGFLFITAMGSVSAADTSAIYVNASYGNDSWDGTSWEQAKLTINNALNTVDDGGTIYIANGIYSGENNTNMTINKNVTFIGESQNGTIINGTNNSTLFSVNITGNFTLKNITLTNGSSSNSGGAICIYNGTVNIINTTVTGCTAPYGGVIFNVGMMNIADSTFMGNIAGSGGIIFNTGIVNITNSLITGNNASENAGAIMNLGAMNITNSTLTNNTAYIGGAIMNNGPLNITNSLIAGNFAYGGGAIYNTEATLTILNSAINGNVALLAGAIMNGGTVNIVNSTVNDNTASEAAGAIYNVVTVNIANSTLNSNTAPVGGAIYNDGGVTTVNFSSLVKNMATNGGSAVYCRSGSVNATCNWWGSNDSPLSQIYMGDGNVDYSPWLYMTLTADSTSVNYGSSTSVRVIFNNICNGTDVTPVDPADGHIPDGTNVNFTTTIGSIDPLKTITRNGITVTRFNATVWGNGTITANADAENLELSMNVLKASTATSVMDVVGNNGETVNLTATLTDASGNLLGGKPVEFYVNGTSVGNTTTDGNGRASLAYKLASVGDYVVVAGFAGETGYDASQGSGAMHVDPAANLTLTAINSNRDPAVGDVFLVTYKLTNYGPDVARDVTVTFTLPEGLEYVNLSVNGGKCSYDPATRLVTWTLADVPVGDTELYLTLRAAFGGDYTITPRVVPETYNWGSTGVLNVMVRSENSSENSSSSSNGSVNSVNAASSIQTVGMQSTGTNLIGLVLGILAVLGGAAWTRKRY